MSDRKHNQFRPPASSCTVSLPDQLTIVRERKKGEKTASLIWARSGCRCQVSHKMHLLTCFSTPVGHQANPLRHGSSSSSTFRLLRDATDEGTAAVAPPATVSCPGGRAHLTLGSRFSALAPSRVAKLQHAVHQIMLSRRHFHSPRNRRTWVSFWTSTLWQWEAKEVANQRDHSQDEPARSWPRAVHGVKKAWFANLHIRNLLKPDWAPENPRPPATNCTWLRSAPRHSMPCTQPPLNRASLWSVERERPSQAFDTLDWTATSIHSSCAKAFFDWTPLPPNCASVQVPINHSLSKPQFPEHWHSGNNLKAHLLQTHSNTQKKLREDDGTQMSRAVRWRHARIRHTGMNRRVEGRSDPQRGSELSTLDSCLRCVHPLKSVFVPCSSVWCVPSLDQHVRQC